MEENNEEENNQKNESPKEEWEKQLEECSQAKAEYLAGWQRTQADFANYQKNEAERTRAILDFAKMNWLLELLKVYDNFERASAHAPQDLEDSEWVRGVKQIQNQLWGLLKGEGVQEIQALRQMFNPNLHEALAQGEEAGHESDMVIEVLEKGYLLNGKLLRPAKVKVTK